jgi:hypothetical protein
MALTTEETALVRSLVSKRIDYLYRYAWDALKATIEIDLKDDEFIIPELNNLVGTSIKTGGVGTIDPRELANAIVREFFKEICSDSHRF